MILLFYFWQATVTNFVDPRFLVGFVQFIFVSILQIALPTDFKGFYLYPPKSKVKHWKEIFKYLKEDFDKQQHLRPHIHSFS